MKAPAQSCSTPASPVDYVFDVRTIPCRVKHMQIIQRWLDLPVGQSFVLLNDHDPVPLRYQFQAEFADAFSWDHLERGPEDFRVRITKLKPVANPRAPVAAPAVEEIDVRGFEPPEPRQRILARLKMLPPGTKLRACTDREPVRLLCEAERQGFRHDGSEQPDGSWITLFTRAAGPRP